MRRNHPVVKRSGDCDGGRCILLVAMHDDSEPEQKRGSLTTPPHPQDAPASPPARELTKGLPDQRLKLILVQLHPKPSQQLVPHLTPAPTGPFHLSEECQGCDERPIFLPGSLFRGCAEGSGGQAGPVPTVHRDWRSCLFAWRPMPIGAPTPWAPDRAFGTSWPPGVATPETGLLPQHAHIGNPLVSSMELSRRVSLSEMPPVPNLANL